MAPCWHVDGVSVVRRFLLYGLNKCLDSGKSLPNRLGEDSTLYPHGFGIFSSKKEAYIHPENFLCYVLYIEVNPSNT